jgi:sugar fermentation stimulation protein A
MKYNKKIYEGIFLSRPNRFNARVLFNGQEIVIHVPNTGRCKELLIPGSTILLREESNPTRKTAFDLIGVYKGNELISIDSQIPNKVVYEALVNKAVDKLVKYSNIFREKTFGTSRFDFLLTNEEGEEYYLEVKGVTLEEEGHCRFPDAPTERGRKHLLELIEVKKSGRGAGVLFLIQLKDANKFSPNDDTDPAFGETLRLAAKNGVDIFAYSCNVLKEEIIVDKIVEIIL